MIDWTDKRKTSITTTGNDILQTKNFRLTSSREKKRKEKEKIITSECHIVQMELSKDKKRKKKKNKVYIPTKIK